ncbi:MAG: putative branched-chain amino acid transport ATP-binding protein LivG [Euryarchaeota archaeon ADurb.BinA087]|nr:MAG: putative branched-chain amino acid transport ATP-binding protein LivG [Euryarchaeota archaeon ADurb.BinA087]
MTGPSDDKETPQTAIVVDHVSKKFRIPLEKKYTVYQHLFGIFKGGYYSYNEFLALDDISFTVNHGESFGIIGPNGSGKSTLLKLIAGILYPDKGYTRAYGRIAPFIELGVGFHPELTARENIFLYGSILGLKKNQIREKYDEILSFSELKKFENMKIKNFSSGMTARLAFATAIQTDPDILLIDEMLAVGDEEFNYKVVEKINEMKEREVTIVFVSHALRLVQQYCSRTLLLSKGKIIQIGDTSQVIEKYLQITREHQ